MSRSRRGYYAILTTFFFVLVTVGIMLGVFYLQSQLLGVEATEQEQTRSYHTVQAAKDTVIGCNGGVTFSKDELNSGLLSECRPASVNGISLIGENPCQANRWDAGNRTGSTYDYYVILAANQSCMARLKIYYED